ncbi:S1C family serine protease [Alloiococcus sp. CFN-8]|uniref:S1C family serine protease n=1 Tax=Alloiococcus sp. CFN-8 TaxID=3416081 RepID=UPI003CF18FD6
MQNNSDKDSLWAWKDIKKENKKRNTEGEIKFKQNYRKQRVNDLMKALGLIVIAVLSGFVSAYFFFTNLDTITVSTGGDSSLEERENLSSTMSSNGIYKVVSGVYSSVVGIGGSEESFTINALQNTANISGFIIKNDGYIVTNYSGVKDLEKVYVKLPDGDAKPLEASIVGFDIDSDIVLLKVDAFGLTVAKIGDVSNSIVGDTVIAVSNNIGEDYIGTVTTGIISSTNKKMELTKDNAQETLAYALLQTTLSLNNYNEGGVIVNLSGEVLGIISRTIDGKYTNAGLNHAISIAEITKIIDGIITGGESKRPSLGIVFNTITGSNEGEVNGVYVTSLTQDGAGAKAGINVTDIIIKLDGTDITKKEDIYEVLEKRKVGDLVECIVWREGTTETLTIQLEAASK